MAANRSRKRREELQKATAERLEARANRTPLAQLRALKRRGIAVPISTNNKAVKALNMDTLTGKYCREVIRLVDTIQSA